MTTSSESGSSALCFAELFYLGQEIRVASIDFGLNLRRVPHVTIENGLIYLHNLGQQIMLQLRRDTTSANAGTLLRRLEKAELPTTSY